MNRTTIVIAAAAWLLLAAGAAAQPVPDGGGAQRGAGRLKPPQTSALHRTVFHEEKRGRYEISIAYPEFKPPADAAQTAFNGAAHDIAFGTEAGKKQAGEDIVAIYRSLDPPMAKGANNFYEVEYQVPYSDRRVASVLFEIGEYSGGAHPNSARIALLFDLERGRPLHLSDILADPKPAIEAIAAQCKAQLEAEAKKEDWELFDNADVGAAVGDAAAWSAGKDGVDVLFNPYSVAAYVVGPRDCRLSYVELSRWLKPGGPLPPQQEEQK